MKNQLTLLCVACLGMIAMAIPEADAGCLFCKKRASCDTCNTCQTESSCCSGGCGVAAASCCCSGMGVANLGNYAAIGHLNHYYHYPNRWHGYTGYEGLPNMDGRSVHGRYPYHSYRRPWAHPGPRSTNITIVW